MNNYFRITAYHPEKDISVIMDSNGVFDKLWKFSAYLVSKGFKVLQVGNDETFKDGNIPKAEYNEEKIILRACDKGEAKISNGTVTVNGRYYTP